MKGDVLAFTVITWDDGEHKYRKTFCETLAQARSVQQDLRGRIVELREGDEIAPQSMVADS